MRVKLANVKSNPYRDMDKYPISESKVSALLESIRQTDFWDNLLARPAGNSLMVEGDELTGQELAEYLKGCEEADFQVELAYGHHRLVAVEKAGISEIDIPVKVIEDEIMLKIMANENKNDWASNMSVILETVRQVRNTLHKQAVEFDKYEDYLEKYSFFSTPKEWKAAQKVSNIGYRKIHQFLGETWSENNIRAASATLDSIDSGLFEQEQVIAMPSVQTMNRFQALAKAIRENTIFPEFFKDLYVQQASEIICDPDKGATVAVIQKAASMVRKNNIPTDYLSKQKVTPFDLTKELKKLATAEGSPYASPDEFLNVEGLADYEGIDEAVEKVKESIKQDAARREKAGGAIDGEEGEGGGEETDEAQAEIDKAEAEAAADAEAGLPPLADVGTEAGADEMAVVFTQSAKVFQAQTERLFGNVDDLDAKVEGELGMAFEDIFSALVVLGLHLYGLEDLKGIMNNAVKDA